MAGIVLQLLYIGPREAERARLLASACSFRSARSETAARLDCT